MRDAIKEMIKGVKADRCMVAIDNAYEFKQGMIKGVLVVDADLLFSRHCEEVASRMLEYFHLDRTGVILAFKQHSFNEMENSLWLEPLAECVCDFYDACTTLPTQTQAFFTFQALTRGVQEEYQEMIGAINHPSENSSLSRKGVRDLKDRIRLLEGIIKDSPYCVNHA